MNIMKFKIFYSKKMVSIKYCTIVLIPLLLIIILCFKSLKKQNEKVREIQNGYLIIFLLC